MEKMLQVYTVAIRLNCYISVSEKCFFSARIALNTTIPCGPTITVENSKHLTVEFVNKTRCSGW